MTVAMTAARLGVSAGSGGLPYQALGAHFDGTNDYIDASGLTTADATRIVMSLWFRRAGGDGTARVMFGATGFRLYAQLSTGNQIVLAARNASNSNILVHTGAPTYTDSGWHHLLAYLKPDGAASSFVYQDGAAATNLTTDTAGTINTAVTSWTIGAFDNTTGKWNGDLAEVWIGDPGRDVTTADVSRFIAGGRPQNLGADGSAPFGAQPMFYHRGAFSDFQTNSGSAGSMAVTGALTAPQQLYEVGT